ncbi:hypothetical protein ACOMHN_052185 [Nucella lapillus]
MATRVCKLLQGVPRRLKQTRHTTTLCLQSFANAQQAASKTPEVKDHVTSGPLGLWDVPGPRSLPGIGAMWQYLPTGRFHGMDLNHAIREMNAMYGDVVREEIVPGLQLVRLFNPKDFADVYRAEGDYPHRVLFGLLSQYNDVHNYGVQGLLTSQNSEWKELRSGVQQPIMQPRTVTAYANQHVHIANDFVERMAQKTDASDCIDDFLPEIYKYVTEAVGTVCFDRRLGLLNDENPEGERFIRANGESLTLTQKELQLLPLYRYVPTPVFARFSSAQDYIRQFSAKYMQQAMAPEDSATKGGRLVQHLLFSSNLTYRQIATFISEFFAAGVDTTGHYLAFSLYAVARTPAVQHRLYQEVKGLTDQDISSGALHSAPYLRAVLKESLRMYPVAPGLGRTLKKDAVLGGYHVPAGTNVAIHYDMAGKDGRFVANPDTFLPERWLRQCSARRSSRENMAPYFHLPFGFGPRSCPGRRLASQEVAIGLTKILQRFHVVYQGGDLPIRMQILNTPDVPLHFRFRPRSC